MKTVSIAPISLEMIEVETLKSHPLNHKIYDDAEISETSPFFESIRDYGLLEPIVILNSGYVISGHRRLKVLVMLNVTHAECNVRHDLGLSHQAAEVTSALILYNDSRVKTTEEVAREAKFLAMSNSALGMSRAESAAKIAGDLDIGTRTARNVVDAVEETAEARERGDDEAADAIENAEGVRERNAAVSQAKQNNDNQPKAKPRSEVQLVKKLRKAIEKVSRDAEAPAEMANDRRNGQGTRCQQDVSEKLQAAIGVLNDWIKKAGGSP